MKKSIKKISILSTITLLLGFIILASFVNPELGEKILYGKKGIEKNQYMEYSEIITSGNYRCMESASVLADGNLSRFVKEFNNCNIKS